MTSSNESVDVIVRELKLNPSCEHGPTILFSTKTGKKYFSCAGLRSHECFYLNFEEHQVEIASQTLPLNNETPAIKTGLSYDEVQKLKCERRIYCETCAIFVNSTANHQSHKTVTNISDEFLQQPSLFLQQLDNDKLNAQYFFDDHTLDFICSTFECLNLRKIICMGTPRLHDYIRNKRPKIKSILLDIDDRFEAFNQPESFVKFNMFNSYFFRCSGDEIKLINFLKDDQSANSQHCVFSDPPFAARTELLTESFRKISSDFNRINSHHKKLPIFWVFPYFNEQHVKREMPEMEMMDFQVRYMNHKTYHDEYKGRKAGSPVRIFTNVDLKLIKYPSRFTNYRFCSPCKRSVSINNHHCDVCKACPSKNGSTYRHCQDCITCVKPNYVHCSTCNRCVSKLNHDCIIYQKHQECWMCGDRGHVEKNCVLMKKFKRRKDGSCIVCKGKLKHNLRKCKSKLKYLAIKKD